ncbi:MAG TPA: bifunctional UDP-N-acetylglucosamine diphosphorylase/glucosamine-1-phosphate N-acetyltransferase GlmU [Hyphomicrobiaceae bacterium]|nr:bifunctional UDP-N-acetylglucosamine diphosphorylase/glucosamine-1-phosphate N-acetyltransferase GlmU [Hyphomicrobiaceae bacterium]
MSKRTLLTVILAAGKGTRMKSALPKVLHRIAGRSMLGHVMATAKQAGADRLAVVIGPGMEDVRAEVLRHAPGSDVYIQDPQLGTAHAVLAARKALAGHAGDVLILYADTPLIRADTLQRLVEGLDQRGGVGVLGFEAADPTGYGRLVTDTNGALLAIREHKDASDAERVIRLCNSGVMVFRCPSLVGLLDRVGNANAKGEYYLTDTVEIARRDGLGARAIVCPEDEVLGVNSRDQLAAAEAIWQARARHAAMLGGVTMVAPETVWLSYDTTLGQDVVIEPNVVFGPGVTVADRVDIRANCHIEGAHIASGARIGPFARLRPGADLGADVHIGNFVEVKNVTMAAGAKANHLAYLGDGSVGEDANIGAGTIFCNYDGFNKHTTTVGKGAFVGSNSALVAPVTIGDGAFVGSGSVITRDVAPDALAVERSVQEERPEWARKFRTLMQRKKQAKRDKGAS